MKKKISIRPPQITIEVNDELVSELKEIKRVTKISKSQLIRDAVWKEIASVKRTHPAYRALETPTVNSTTEITN